jgi:16S rRNA (guanine527-N7)-methyltransferase
MIKYNSFFLKGLSDLGFTLSNEQTKQFFDFTNLLLEWNEKINLTSIVDIREIIIKHFFDSIAPLTYLIKNNILRKNQKIIDMGAGAGFPSIPIKILFPDFNIFLSEVNKKKLRFLSEVINLLKLDCPLLDPSQEKIFPIYNIILVRAFGNLNKIHTEAKKYISKGKIIAYKGKLSKINDELSECNFKKSVIKEINVPLLSQERHVVIVNIPKTS